MLALSAAGLLTLAFWPLAFHVYWAPKAAVCLVLVGPGLVALAGQLVGRSRSAWLAAGFLAWAGVSTLMSRSPTMALIGGVNAGTGLIFVAVLVGCWSLGREVEGARRRQLAGVIVGAAVANALVAWFQARGLVPPALESPGRAAGFTGNPVHLGAICAGALWLAAGRAGRERGHLGWLLAVGALAGGTQLSGGRAAFVVGAVAVLLGIREAGLRRRAVIIAAAAAGVVLFPIGAEGALLASGRSVGADAGAQVGLRLDLWRIGLEALGDRPLVGYGPGRFEAATSPRLSASLAGSGTANWTDAHNWVVEYAVTTGVVGLLLAGAWLAAAARRARGPLAGFALLAGAYLLVEPQSVVLTPLILLALGASGPGPPPRPGAERWWTLARVGAGLMGLGPAGLLLAGEVFLERGFTDASRRDFSRAHRVLPPWPEVSVVGSRIESFRAIEGRSEERRRTALSLAREATRRDPAHAGNWARLASLEVVWGGQDRAEAAVGRALERNPWNALALRTRIDLAQRRGDGRTLEETCRRLGRLRTPPAPCPGATMGTGP